MQRNLLVELKSLYRGISGAIPEDNCGSNVGALLGQGFGHELKGSRNSLEVSDCSGFGSEGRGMERNSF